MDDLGGASQATDRRIKGVTQQSSNATKNFSKQAQTMQGGIVACLRNNCCSSIRRFGRFPIPQRFHGN